MSCRLPIIIVLSCNLHAKYWVMAEYNAIARTNMHYRCECGFIMRIYSWKTFYKNSLKITTHQSIRQEARYHGANSSTKTYIYSNDDDEDDDDNEYGKNTQNTHTQAMSCQLITIANIEHSTFETSTIRIQFNDIVNRINTINKHVLRVHVWSWCLPPHACLFLLCSAKLCSTLSRLLSVTLVCVCSVVWTHILENLYQLNSTLIQFAL